MSAVFVLVRQLFSRRYPDYMEKFFSTFNQLTGLTVDNGFKKYLSGEIEKSAKEVGISSEDFTTILSSYATIGKKNFNKITNYIGENAQARIKNIITYADKRPDSSFNRTLRTGKISDYLQTKNLVQNRTPYEDLDKILSNSGLSAAEKKSFAQKLRNRIGDNRKFDRNFIYSNKGANSVQQALKDSGTNLKDLAKASENGQLWDKFFAIF